MLRKNFKTFFRYQQMAALSSSVVMANTVEARIVTDIIKSQNDDRSHRGLVLSNGLKVGRR